MTVSTPPRHNQDGVSLVEVLVAMLLASILGTSVFNVVMSSNRTEIYQRQWQEVIDDGRLSMEAIRRELRAARSVYPDSASDRLRFWVDQNQDANPDASEQICYAVENIGTGQWAIVRWEEATNDCIPGSPPSGASLRSVAQTLVDPDVFAYDPVPSGDPDDPPTRIVDITLDLQVIAPRGPDNTLVESSVRLRNVP
jgi:prepilin-type N-terminal cleavage/methylation domain-containing protein